MVKIKLSKEEKRILKNYNKTSRLILVRLKSQAVLLRSKKMKIKDIADVLDKDNRTIGRWLWDFKKDDWQASLLVIKIMKTLLN